MIRINLLPHREEKRKERRQQFYTLSGAMVLLGAAIALLVHTIYAGYIERQETKNAFIKAEIVKLDEEIVEIRRLREQIDSLLARKQVIESLQSSRAETVHLFNELARKMPNGVYLKSVKQAAQQVTLVGYAQSNARVSTLMRSLDESPFLQNPGLVEVKSATVNNRRVSEFILNIGIAPPSAENAQAAQGGAQ
ncbi:MAG: fimbrial protein [Azoarcus sp.]|uniref:Fimbrial protein n=1 Tax=Parazoarcus communis TaxID=41977 RepID=A0A2U8GQZ2_9RHOO|nr:PilN domain-containing protein [Parazoarcus communis]AWI75934.1 fimbrial protein [Parazoarcus communis]PKO58240.1 MAG: fimbrial protein [Betaproteobacteria bacterium HGW-Betaproteobacteria-19]PLX69110.1 MAG: fimbrial protein [Azoarcus sp.]TVT51901.1 MAG: PilN domain-containing protein [Azoarcus sp. PHD]